MGEDRPPLSMFFRKRINLRLPITLSVIMMALNVTLMVFWIVLLAQDSSWGALTIGTLAFTLILVGLSLYLALTIKAIKLNRRQANFVDSVTHELKSPIAALKLYLETMEMRRIPEEQLDEFVGIMKGELGRLDQLISQLLEVGRLDAIGRETEPEEIKVTDLLKRCAQVACAHHECDVDRTFLFQVQPASIHARRIVVEMIFTNLMDNAIKYGGDEPEVIVSVEPHGKSHLTISIIDNGDGVPAEIRKKIFGIFYRGGEELKRKKTGTGLGLHIAKTLVHTLKGKITVKDRPEGSGSVFEVELPGSLG